MPFTQEVAGISGGFQFTGSDAISPDLLQAFLNNMKVLYGYSLGGDASSTSPINWSASELALFQSSINTLISMGKNGYPILSTGNPPAVIGTAYMPIGMVDALNQLFKSLKAAGAADLSNLSRDDIQNWVNLNVQNNSVLSIFGNIARLYVKLPSSGTVSTIPPTYSTDPAILKAQLNSVLRLNSVTLANEALAKGVQAFTEVEYIGAANEVITQTLSSLRDNLSSTKTIVDSLTALQNVHNNITVASRRNPFAYTFYNNVFNISISTYQQQYQKYASTWLQAPIVPQLTAEVNPWTLLQTGQAEIAKSYHYTGNPAGIDYVTYSVRINQSPPNYYWFNPDTNTVTANSTYTFSIILPPDKDYLAGIPADTFVNAAQYMGALNPTYLQELIDTTNGATTNPFIPTPRGYLAPISTMESLKNQLIGLRNTLAQQLAFLSQSTVTPLSTQNDPTKRALSLLGQLSTVYTDLVNNLKVNGTPIDSTTNTVAAATGIRNWIMDNYQSFATAGATNSGKIQQNLTTAITSAQSTNDVQKENVRNYLTVFEEYYKSASSVLTALNQMISKMAQNINR